MAAGMEKLQSAAQGGVSYRSHISCKISIYKYSLQRIALNYMLHNMEKSGWLDMALTLLPTTAVIMDTLYMVRPPESANMMEAGMEKSQFVGQHEGVS